MAKLHFNPGCALSLYKPEFEVKILKYLNDNFGEVALHKICCHHHPELESGSTIINVCPGCDRRFSHLYEGIMTISLWEIIDGLEEFPYPDYGGLRISIQDACPVRQKIQVHQAVRNLLQKMNFTIVETKLNRTHSLCCGDSFYPKLPMEEIHQKMKERAQSMPCQDVCVYCVSCIQSMAIGGRTPRYLLDLLLGEPTEPLKYDTETWHQHLQAYIDAH
ncbi:MAG TPA: (Fe-S)-binding protein [Bacillota bacterium]|nr:(Fe-S)-binding protein [Bacillota bacterium]HPT88316.1 (Fe-S)-binding protein [Bacillota bacterium]